MDNVEPFDRRLRRLRRDRAAALWQRAEPLQRMIDEELLERLALVKRDFRSALIVNAADGVLAAQLRARGLEVAGTDHGGRFAARAGALHADEDRLEFPSDSFDLILAPGGLDSVNDLPGALVQLRRALRPDGLLLAAMAGAGSLPRLRAAMFASDEGEGRPTSAHIHPQIDLKSAGDLLRRAGFALPVADSLPFDLRYGSLAGLVQDLRALGATNLLASRARRPIGRTGLAAAVAEFAAAAAPDGKTSERIEIIFMTGWAPAPDQPQPARRGSATRSLADALKPPR